MPLPAFDAAALRQMRLLLKDMSATPTFTDQNLTDYWSIEGGVLKRAAALALESIAQDTARVLQYVKTTGLETNGKTAAEAVLLVSDRWRTQAETDRTQKVRQSATGFLEVSLL
jgi:hypothetical protein